MLLTNPISPLIFTHIQVIDHINVSSVIIVLLRNPISPDIFSHIQETNLSSDYSVIIVLLRNVLSPNISEFIQVTSLSNVSSVVIVLLRNFMSPIHSTNTEKKYFGERFSVSKLLQHESCNIHPRVNEWNEKSNLKKVKPSPLPQWKLGN